jgi:hypothetical protein
MILLSAFSPYHIGSIVIGAIGARDTVTATRFPGIITTLSGYLLICFLVFIAHSICKLLRIQL